jgi:DNA topoisomerase-1
MKLFIVESPAKAKTINTYLGKEFVVVATMGHIKDLPRKEMGIDFSTLEPRYVFLPGKKKIATKIVEISKKAEEIFLASDKDREGEIISYHVKELVWKYNKNVKRVEFGEITKNVILEAIKSPRDININLVNAQKTRRMLDRLVGYIVSPILSKSLGRELKKRLALSAGRVQSPALRILCDRELEIKNFVPTLYYDVFILCQKEGKSFRLKLTNQQVHGKVVYFSSENRIDENKLKEIKEKVKLSEIYVRDVKIQKDRIIPLPPFKTSTLQQDASTKLGFSPNKTMAIAQELYEGMNVDGEFVGLITYMRTDSVRISEYALNKVRDFIKERIGEEYLSQNPRVYENKGTSQDAHECIRPTDVYRVPAMLRGKIPEDHYKLYDLIWRRFVACQMKDAVLLVTDVLASDGIYNFTARTKTILEKNFMNFYPHSVPDDVFLPKLEKNEKLDVLKLEYEKKFTQPPPRYTEATLIKKLEEEGIGRPSTYATIISTLLERKYVEKKAKSLVPTELGFKVYEFLKKTYPDVVDLKFTSYMESLLDDIESGKIRDWKNVLLEMVKKVIPSFVPKS